MQLFRSQLWCSVCLAAIAPLSGCNPGRAEVISTHNSTVDQPVDDLADQQTLTDDALDDDGSGDFRTIVSPTVGSAHPTVANSLSTRSADLVALPTTVPVPFPEPIAPPLPLSQVSPAATPTSSDMPAAAAPPGGFLLNPAALNGERIADVMIYLENPTTDGDRNQQFQQQIAAAFAVKTGDSYSPLFLNRGLQQVTQLEFVETAQYELYEVQIPGEVVVVLSVRLTEEPLAPTQATGLFVTGNWREFPNLYTSDRATVVAVLRGGLSSFSSNNTWFGDAPLFTQGNPLARDPAGPGTYSWIDGYLEFGAAGITQIDTLPLYVYGGVSNIVSTTLQPDLFESDNRIFSDIEDLYGGLVYGYRTDNSRFGLNLSAGRQDYRISNGMLFANGAGNGGDRQG